MIIVRVPFRVSLFGGGTDFHHFYSKYSSTIVSFSIDKYCYISLRKLMPYFNTKYRISWSKIEECKNIESISHPSIRACLNYTGVTDGLEISTVGDLPARSGLGSSSSFTSALLAALHFYKGDFKDVISLTSETINIEQNVLKENVGIQDQIQVCSGGFNVIKISEDSTYSTVSLNQTSSLVQEINKTIILVYTGISRFSSSVHQSISNERSTTSLEQSLKRINSIANEFASKLVNHDADSSLFIELLLKSWEAKVSTFPSNATTSHICSIYEKALSSGAMCGKLLGAGGGGFFAFFVPPEDHSRFVAQMQPLISVPVSVEYEGMTRIL